MHRAKLKPYVHSNTVAERLTIFPRWVSAKAVQLPQFLSLAWGGTNSHPAVDACGGYYLAVEYMPAFGIHGGESLEVDGTERSRETGR